MRETGQAAGGNHREKRKTRARLEADAAARGGTGSVNYILSRLSDLEGKASSTPPQSDACLPGLEASPPKACSTLTDA